MGLQLAVSLFTNPWDHSIPDDTLVDILKIIAKERALDIEARFQANEYDKAGLGAVILDPTQPPSTPSTEAILATIVIGGEAFETYLPNGLDKACKVRDHGINGGALLFGGESYRIADGGFRWGHGASIGGIPVGASALTQLQDRYQATLVGASLQLHLCEIREEWENKVGQGRWFCNENLPNASLTNALAQPTIRTVQMEV